MSQSVLKFYGSFLGIVGFTLTIVHPVHAGYTNCSNMSGINPGSFGAWSNRPTHPQPHHNFSNSSGGSHGKSGYHYSSGGDKSYRPYHHNFSNSSGGSHGKSGYHYSSGGDKSYRPYHHNFSNSSGGSHGKSGYHYFSGDDRVYGPHYPSLSNSSGLGQQQPGYYYSQGKNDPHNYYPDNSFSNNSGADRGNWNRPQPKDFHRQNTPHPIW